MGLGTFFEMIKEGLVKSYIIQDEDLERLEEEVPLLAKMKKNFTGTPLVYSYGHPKKREGFIQIPQSGPNGDFSIYFEPRGSDYPVEKTAGMSKANGLKSTFEKFMEAGELDIVPDRFVDGSLDLFFKLDPEIKPGDLKMVQILSWSERNKTFFYYNCENYEQLRSIVERALDMSLENVKDANIIILPVEFNKEKNFYSKIKKEMTATYEGLIDDFKKNGFLDPGEIDSDLFGITLMKVAKGNPDFIQILNELPEQAKETWFEYAMKVLKDEKLIFNDKNIEILQKIYQLRPAWNII